MWLISGFAVLALGLAALGVYGALAQSVLDRRHEIGIRLALGAQPRHVLGPMLRRLAAVTGVGLAVGVPAALLSARLLGALLYGVSPADPGLLAAVTAVLLLVAALAAYVPLRRALRVDPLVALRED
jgi:putative ABC transport system permease protein